MNTHLQQPVFHLERTRRQRGVALITVLLVLLILTAIAFGLMYMANTESMINTNFRSTQAAFAASQAGLQEVRDRLTSTIAQPAVAPHGLTTIVGPTSVLTQLPGNANSIFYITNPRPGDGNIDPTNPASAFFDDEFCKENFSALGGGGSLMAQPAAGQPCTAGPPAGSVSGAAPFILSDAPFNGTNAALAYKWIRVTLKTNFSECAGPWANCSAANVAGNQAATAIVVPGTANSVPICFDGSHELPLPAGYASCSPPAPVGSPILYPVMVLTSFALNRNGARRMTQMEVAQTPPIVTNAALDTQDFVNTGGSSVTINGYDNCQCSCTVAKGGAVPTCTNRLTGAACTGNTYAVYTTQTINNSGTPAIIAGTNPATAQNQSNFPYDIQGLAASYAGATGTVNVTGPPYNYSCTGSPANCGTQSGGAFGTLPNPFPPTGDPGPAGTQVTYVPGSIDMTAKTTGNGVLVVNGDLIIEGGMQFYGLIIVTGRFIIKGSGTGQNTNIDGGVLAGQGTSADVISGGVNLQFDHCALDHNQIFQPPSILAFRELAY